MGLQSSQIKSNLNIGVTVDSWGEGLGGEGSLESRDFSAAETLMRNTAHSQSLLSSLGSRRDKRSREEKDAGAGSSLWSWEQALLDWQVGPISSEPL